MTNYNQAPAVANIAAQLIKEHHKHLIGQRIEYVFRDKAQKTKGKIVLGMARLISGLNAFLSTDEDAEEPGEPYFVMEIAYDTWKELEGEQRLALVDHELCHFWCEDVVDEKTGEEGTRLAILPHDVEEFANIIQRHGLWKPDVEHFGRIAAEKVQRPLDFEVEVVIPRKKA